jgi:uncharacterized RDD family membrane protein YckC
MTEQYSFFQLIWSLAIVFIPAVIIWLCYKKSTATHDQKYSTFWPRFMASWVDGLVLWPLFGLTRYILSFDPPTSIAFILWFIQSTGVYFYAVYMHGKYGQTVGKMVCKVRVLTFKKEENINFRIALLRDSIPIVIFVVTLIVEFYLIVVGERTIIELYRPTPESLQANSYLYLMPMFWIVAELVTMLTNKRRRALHDYIAGTVVARTNIED